MSSIQLYDRRHGHCGMTKYLPANGLSRFAVYHYYDQRHVSWIPVFNVDEGVRAGNSGRPPCWERVVDENLIYQQRPIETNITVWWEFDFNSTERENFLSS